MRLTASSSWFAEVTLRRRAVDRVEVANQVADLKVGTTWNTTRARQLLVVVVLVPIVRPDVPGSVGILGSGSSYPSPSESTPRRANGVAARCAL